MKVFWTDSHRGRYQYWQRYWQLLVTLVRCTTMLRKRSLKRCLKTYGMWCKRGRVETAL